jgi:hypothetical protein
MKDQALRDPLKGSRLETDYLGYCRLRTTIPKTSIGNSPLILLCAARVARIKKALITYSPLRIFQNSLLPPPNRFRRIGASAMVEGWAVRSP